MSIEYLCNCYDNGYCNGTRDRDACSCGGDERYCSFYPEKRRAALGRMRSVDCVADIEDGVSEEVKQKILAEGNVDFDQMRNSTTQCATCSHREVCKLTHSLAIASFAANNARTGITVDDENARVIDLPFIHPVILRCKFYKE